MHARRHTVARWHAELHCAALRPRLEDLSLPAVIDPHVSFGAADRSASPQQSVGACSALGSSAHPISRAEPVARACSWLMHIDSDELFVPNGASVSAPVQCYSPGAHMHTRTHSLHRLLRACVLGVVGSRPLVASRRSEPLSGLVCLFVCLLRLTAAATALQTSAKDVFAEFDQYSTRCAHTGDRWSSPRSQRFPRRFGIGGSERATLGPVASRSGLALTQES